MNDGFGTIKEGYFIPHSHVVSMCACGRLLLLPAGATDPDEAIAVGTAPQLRTAPQPGAALDCCR